MARKRKPDQRKIIPDPEFGCPIVSKFINCLMYDGKKGRAEGIFYGSMEVISSKVSEVKPHDVFIAALENVKPHLEVRSRRIGGSTYQIPVDVREERRSALAIRWIILNARNRAGNSMVEKLTGELIDAYNNRGNAVKKKEETHKMAESNRAFAHYIW